MCETNSDKGRTCGPPLSGAQRVCVVYGSAFVLCDEEVDQSERRGACAFVVPARRPDRAARAVRTGRARGLPCRIAARDPVAGGRAGGSAPERGAWNQARDWLRSGVQTVVYW